MRTFKSKTDVTNQTDLDSDLLEVIGFHVDTLIEAFKTHFRPYDPEEDGFVVLIEEADQAHPLAELSLDHHLHRSGP